MNRIKQHLAMLLRQLSDLSRKIRDDSVAFNGRKKSEADALEALKALHEQTQAVVRLFLKAYVCGYAELSELLKRRYFEVALKKLLNERRIFIRKDRRNK